VRLAEEGKYREVIDRTYNLADVVEAHRLVDSGRKRGNVVLRVHQRQGHNAEGVKPA
jgi:NADPH:quinone reductase-like Zn-dependent oxidoreductase